MQNETLLKLVNFYNDTQAIVAVIIGSMVQVAFIENKTRRTYYIVLITAIFASLYIARPFIVYLSMEESYLQPTVYAIVSVSSIELLGVIIKIAPKAFSQRLKKALGFKEEASDNQ